MRLTKRLWLGFFILVVVAVLTFVGWANSILVPAPEAFSALRSDAQVTVSLDKFLAFQPANKKPSAAFVFYPGGRVDYRSYSAPLHQIAAQGYLVILMPVPLNLAVFDVNAADQAVSAFPAVQHWVVGGHSLGGVAAAIYASKHDDIDGLILWASYPADDTLKNSGLKVLSIYGTLDRSGMEAFDNSRDLLPSDTQYVVIQGGNHAQFGDYGFQPGDNEATITRVHQQKQVVDATAQFLKELSQ